MNKLTGLVFGLLTLSILMSFPVSAQGMQWTELETSSAPPARRSHAMAYDQDSNVVVIFGGFGNGSHLADTWALDMKTRTWKNMQPAVAPSARAAATMVYDHASKQMILFGGFGLGHSISSNETWIYKYPDNQWTEIQTKSAPSERASYGMALDSERHGMVLFGGFTESGYFNDVWVYDIDREDWTHQEVTGAKPDPRGAMSFVYDTKIDKFVMFGGFSSEGYFSDTWILDPNSHSWTEIHPETSPPPIRTRMVYDEEDGGSVFFGGDTIPSVGHLGSPQPSSKTWFYDPTKQSWIEIRTSTAPAPRALNGIAYDNTLDVIVIFGGTDTLIDDANFVGREFSDTWMLTIDSSGHYLEGAASVIIVLVATAVVGAFVLAKKRRHKSSEK